MNILFIMYDQLRFDYLGCAGHPHLETPNFDRVARMGVRFTNAYAQSPICGPSRMSFYTGRYVSSHGAQWNNFPLRVGEHTLGDHLRVAGMDCWLIGKTHMKADAEGMARLGLSPDSVIGARQAECGFDVRVRDDGLWAEGPDGSYDEKRLIVYDPRPEAAATRGTACDALVEAIDLAPTFVEAAGGTVADHILEGRSLMPWLHGRTPRWRDFVISEYDYSITPMRDVVGVAPRNARLFMVFDGRFKLIHAEGGFRPMLFDLENDPDELDDLAKGPGHEAEIARLYDRLAGWGRRMSQRVTCSDADIEARRDRSARRGILPFLKDGSEVPEELTSAYRGPVVQNHLSNRGARER